MQSSELASSWGLCISAFGRTALEHSRQASAQLWGLEATSQVTYQHVAIALGFLKGSSQYVIWAQVSRSLHLL